MSESQLLVNTESGVTVVTFRTASILDGSAIEGIGRELFDLVDNQAQRKLILDFHQVKFLSSSMLGVLIQLQKKAGAIKGRAVIVNLKPELRKVFTITRLDKLFTFFDSDRDALESFGVGA